MNIDTLVSQYLTYIVIALAALVLVLFIIVIVQGGKLSKLKKNYKAFTTGNDGKSLEEIIKTRIAEIDEVKEQTESLNADLKKTSEVLQTAYQKVGIVKYDAFKEMGGKLSFALALLNDENNGFILNSMHSSREGCYTYVKEIIHGESYVILAEEEKQALQTAMDSKNFMK